MIIIFDLTTFLLEKRITATELAEKMGVTPQLVSSIKHRGRINMKTLRKLESLFGDCTSYISQKQPKQKNIFQSTGNGLETDWKAVGNQLEKL